MKKYIYIFLAFCFCNLSILKSQSIGEWKVYMSYHDATKTVPANDLVYVLSDGSLYSYNIDDTSIQTYDKTNYLSDVAIADMAYIKNCHTLLLVYENSNIDLLINDEETFNITDFMNKTMQEDKTLNNIYVHNEYAYLSTNFGIVVVNANKKEITNTYNFGFPVRHCTIAGNTIYAATDNGIYEGNMTDNLLDQNNWHFFNEMTFSHIIYFDNHLIGIGSDAIYLYNNDTRQFENFYKGNYLYCSTNENKLMIGDSFKLVVYENSIEKMNVRYFSDNTINYMTCENNMYWSSNGASGLNGYKLNDNGQLEKVVSSIIPNSPRRNLDSYLIYTDKLLIAGGGIWFDRYFNPGTIMQLTDSGEWEIFDENIESKSGFPFLDINYIAQDPSNPNHIFASAAGEGVYEFNDKQFVKLYNIDNSPLEAVASVENKHIYTRIAGLRYDKDGNLWILNSMAEKASIKILKPDNTWIQLSHKEFLKQMTLRNLIFDQRGWAWVVSARTGAGIFCLNTNNTLENTNDDESVFWQTFVSQNGEVITPYNVYCAVEDLDGAIWIGTSSGPLVINNPANIFESNSCTKIIVPRNDGSNLGDYLLEHETVKDICIDGANRKWIGTETNGIYLISEDGMETIHHFTTENSPLVSNNILSIAINPNSGEVYIGTDKGLVAYRSDATSGVTKFNDDIVQAYPNPVPSYYNGTIAITGLMRNSNVKIVDISGKLVYAGTSTGGQFTWDGRNANGSRVPSGIYLVLATDASGKEGVATKIAIVN